MKTKDIETFVFNGKNYNLLSRNFQDAFFALGFLTFRYYPEEKLLISSDRFVEVCQVQKFFSDMPASFADSFIAETEKKYFFKFWEELEEGGKKVSGVFENRDRKRFRITVVPSEWNSRGDLITVCGFVEDVEKEMRSDMLFKALAKEDGSIY